MEFDERQADPTHQKRFQKLSIRECITLAAVAFLTAGAMAQLKWHNPYVQYYLGPYGRLFLFAVGVGGLLWFVRKY